MVEAAIGIEADRCQHDRQMAREHGVGERQHRVHRIGRRSAIARIEAEGRKLAAFPARLVGRRLDQAGQGAKIGSRRVALDAQQRGEGRGVAAGLAGRRKTVERGLAILRRATPVPPQHRSLVRDLGRHQLPGEAQAGRLVEAHAVLRRPDLDIAMTDAVRDAAEPAAVAVEGDGDLALEQCRERRGRDRDVAEQGDIGHVDQAHPRIALLLVGDLEGLAFLADPRILRLHDERQRLVGRRGDRPRRQRRARERTDLVGQADRHQGAARAFRAVLQRRRNAALGYGQAQPADRRARRGAQRLVEHDSHALATLGIVDGAFLDAVAVLFQQQRLQADLDTLGLVGAQRDMRAPAALVVDRRHDAVLGLGDVELGNDAQALGGKRQRAADDLVGRCRIGVLEGLGRRQRRARPIDAPVNALAFDRVAGLRPFALGPHEVGQARTIDELVHHARRDERRVAGHRRRR